MRQKGIFAIGLLFILSVVLPSYGFVRISPQERREVSRQIKREIEREEGRVVPMSARNPLFFVFLRLVKKTHRKDIKYKPELVESKNINAMALPDGEILFYQGLINTFRHDKNALAFVAAHELSHLEKHHPEKKIKNALVTGVAISLLVNKKDQVARILGSVANNLIVSGYSRGIETEADLEALKLMKRAGYDPNGALIVFKTFIKLEKKHKELRIYPTHPKAEDRFKNVVRWMKKNHIPVRVHL